MTGDDRLRDELESLERAAPADLPPRPSSSRPAWWRSLAAPTAVVVTAVLVTVVVAPGLINAIRPTSSPLATDSGAATARGSASTKPASPSLAWHVVPFDEPGAILIAITEIDGRLIMTGIQDGHPQAWYSDDGGAAWFRCSRTFGGGPLEDVLMPPGSLRQVAGSADRLVAVGTWAVGANDADVATAMWFSDDLGATWQHIPDENVPPGVTDIAWDGSEFLAVSGRITSAAVDLVSNSVRVWASANGEEWQPIAGPDPFGTSVVLLSVAASSGLTALTIAGGGPNQLWLSEDGRAWYRGSNGTTQIEPTALAADASGIVVIGTSGTSTSTVFHTTDGLTWTTNALDLSGPAPFSDVTVNAVSAGPAGLLMSGRASVGYSLGEEHSWFLPAGESTGQLLDAARVDAVARGDTFVGIARCPQNADCLATTLLLGLPSGQAAWTPTITDAPQDQAVSCEPPPVGTATTLLCDRAVTVAISAWGGDRTTINSIDFHFGAHCPIGARCAATPKRFDIGWVMLRIEVSADGSEKDVFVSVAADEEGVVTVTGIDPPLPS